MATAQLAPVPQITVDRVRPQPRGWRGWVTTTDHKRIGILYMVTTFAFFCLGGVEALLMRLQQEMTGSEDFVEGVMAFVQKRAASFSGR